MPRRQHATAAPDRDPRPPDRRPHRGPRHEKRLWVAPIGGALLERQLALLDPAVDAGFTTDFERARVGRQDHLPSETPPTLTAPTRGEEKRVRQ
jgi:hypothetical protein